jgi:cytochrome c5
VKKRYIFNILLVLSGVLGFLFSLYVHRPHTDVVQPAETFHYPMNFVKQIQGDPQAGMKIFKEYCASCHAKTPLIDVKAPPIGDKNAWDERRKKGDDELLKVTLRGKGAMPARGGCFECSDAQLQETIRYMLNQN